MAKTVTSKFLYTFSYISNKKYKVGSNFLYLLQQSSFKEIEWDRINKNTYMITGSK
ncbi:hypothetical protein UT300001_23950 [Clostridium sp. CTA-1]